MYENARKKTETFSSLDLLRCVVLCCVVLCCVVLCCVVLCYITMVFVKNKCLIKLVKIKYLISATSIKRPASNKLGRLFEEIRYRTETVIYTKGYSGTDRDHTKTLTDVGSENL